MVTGRTIVIYQESTQIAAIRSNSIGNECDMLEKASPSSGTWREYEPGRQGWTIQIGTLMPLVSNIKDVLKVRQSYTIAVKTQDGTSLLTGTAICKSARIDSNIENLCTGSFVFQGSGPLTDPSVT